jgi:ketosteroid isomerase-like protein
MAQEANAAAANKALMLKFMNAAQSADAQSMYECLTEDYVQIWPRPGIPGQPGQAEGRDTAVGYLKHLTIYKPGSMKMTVENMVAEEKFGAIQFKLNAVTAAGEPYENFYCQFFEFRDGLIAKQWEYLDTRYATRKLKPELLDAV